MAKIDEVKEILTTLRLFFSLGIGLVVVITGALIRKEDSGDVDIYFWVGSLIDVILIISLVLLVKSIKKYTKMIKDL